MLFYVASARWIGRGCRLVPKVLLDTTTYVDLQRAKRHLRQSWAINTIKHAAAHNSAEGKPYLSTLAPWRLTKALSLLTERPS